LKSIYERIHLVIVVDTYRTKVQISPAYAG